MYEDNKHIITKVKIKNFTFVRKKFKNNSLSLLKKELGIQNYLNKFFVICPEVIKEYKTSFYENYINSKKFNIKEHIVDLAKLIKKLHSIPVEKISKELKFYINNNFYNDNKYNLVMLYNEIINPVPKIFFDENIIKKIDKFIVNAEKYINKNPIKLCIIHGDLNEGNILMRNNEEFRFIDFGDSRLDLPTFDIAQFIYLYNLKQNEIKDFIDAYGDVNIDFNIIDVNMLLLYLYDFVMFYKNNRIKNLKIYKKIKEFIYEKGDLFCSTSR